MFKQWIITIFALLCVQVSVHSIIMQEAHSTYRYNKSAVKFKTHSQMTRTPVVKNMRAFTFGLCRFMLHKSMYKDWFNKAYYRAECVDFESHDFYYRYTDKVPYHMGYFVGWLLDLRLLIPLLVLMYYTRRQLKAMYMFVQNFIIAIWRFMIGLVRLILFWVSRFCGAIARIARNISEHHYINDKQGKQK